LNFFLSTFQTCKDKRIDYLAEASFANNAVKLEVAFVDVYKVMKACVTLTLIDVFNPKVAVPHALIM